MRDFTKTLSVVPAGPLLPLLALPLFPISASPREVGPPQLGRTLWRLFIAFWEVAGAQQKEFGLWNQAGLGSNSCSDIYLPDDLGQDISLLSLKFLIRKPGLLSKLEGSWGHLALPTHCTSGDAGITHEQCLAQCLKHVDTQEMSLALIVWELLDSRKDSFSEF